MQPSQDFLFSPLALPCGTILKNRIAKSAMSDSLGDGTGHPTPEQSRLYGRWARGGVAVSIIGEVQGSADYAEKPGNLVLNDRADHDRFRQLAKSGSSEDTHLWLQMGHAGALAYAPTSAPKGPSSLDVPGLSCAEMNVAEIEAVPSGFAQTARLAQKAGFGGVQIHAAHGFLLSQFLSPLFNLRHDAYGGSIENRMRLLLDSIETTRKAVGPGFPIALKLNATDQLEGGLNTEDALRVVAALERSSVDLIDISGGTYFPGAKSASDGAGRGPYFIDFARQARERTKKPLMLTGGFKKKEQALDAVTSGVTDVVGLARAMVLEPELPNLWRAGKCPNPQFPKFSETPEGGITAWYTMRMTDSAEGRDTGETGELTAAIDRYEARDRDRTRLWLKHFGPVPN